ncbi:extracellular solute-binding protein [Paenibacillus oenotherae]|uniref:Extracellular solute-binding protein n=1 Tax=Paenibacillus oenotherae TaxID=1435645 RepID=A0ABS7DAE0_9BACL|nr:extracellular solute-binding protein [Paenibacillus oenotherae]MBW7476851.1 extracellular solute-binding protein [Paenibacillus oenotherae]
MNKYRNNWLPRVAILLFIISMAAGCATEEPGQGADKEVLRIAVDSRDQYEYTYGDYIDAAFPELEVELIEVNPDLREPLTREEYSEKIEKEKPDLILTYSWNYKEMAPKGLLMDLSTLMADSGMEEADFYPGMIDLMKQWGNGRLYGISPVFSASVLNYNKKLFKEYGIDPPSGGMTMEEVYELGSRFVSSGGQADGIIGFHQAYSNMPYNVLEDFGTREGGYYTSFATGQINIDTPAWRHIIETIVHLYQLGTLSLDEVKGKMIDGVLHYDREASMQADLFEQGKAAMTISNYGTYSTLKNGDETGYVIPPISSADHQRSSNIYVHTAMAIGAEAENVEMAWNVIRFMTSEHMVKVRSKLGTGEGLSSHKAYLNYVSDPVVKELYQLKPFVVPFDTTKIVIDGSKFIKPFEELVNREMIAAVKKEQSVDKLAATLQREGQALLDAARIPE